MPKNAIYVAIGGKAAWPFALQMSASDLKRTLKRRAPSKMLV